MEANGPVSRSAGAEKSRRDFLVAAALGSAAVTAGLLSWRSNAATTHLEGELDKVVPDQIGEWKRSPAERVLIPTADSPAGEIYNDLLTRYYANGAGDMIMFLAAYGNAQSGDAQLHRPEVCYPAAGFALSQSRPMSVQSAGLPTVEARVITASMPGRIEQILYWSRIGNEFPTNAGAQRWAAFRQSFEAAAPDGALIRISMISADQASALTHLNNFALALLSSPDQKLRRLLTGVQSSREGA